MSQPSSSTRFAELLSKARGGDKEALSLLAQEYEPQVRVVARARLGSALRPYLDSVDLVQSVHRSLMLGLRDHRFDITSPEGLVAMAVTIVRRKVARQWRRLRHQHRMDNADSPDIAQLVVTLSTSDPAEIVALRDQTARLFREMTESERQLMELRLEGHTTAEVARRMGCDPEVLRVRLHRLRIRLKDRGLSSDWL